MEKEDYEKAILELLQNNSIISAPSKEVIDLSPQIALALWENFSDGRDYYDSFDPDLWYRRGNWKHLLSKYSEDIEFWEKALETKDYKDKLLIFTDFPKDFPKVAEHFLNSEEKLMKLLDETNNIEFFYMLDKLGVSDEKKEKIHTSYLLNNTYRCEKIDLERYKHNQTFIEQILSKRANLYFLLSEEEQNNPNYIEATLYETEMLFKLSPQNREKFFDSWLGKNTSIRLNTLNLLYAEEKTKALKTIPNLLINVCRNHVDEYKVELKEVFKDNLELGLGLLPSKDLFKVYDRNMIEKSFPVLEKYINEYDNIDGFSSTDTNTIMLIERFPELMQKLRKNPLYNVNNACYYDSKSRINKETFETMFDILTQRYNEGKMTEEMCENKLNKLRSRIDVNVLKVERYPSKNLFNYLTKKKLKEGLEKNLSDNENYIPKFKV